MRVQSKREPAFLVYQATFLIQKNCVQNNRGLLFNLLSYLCHKKNVCLKQAGGCFLVHSSLISIVRLMYCHEKFGMLNQYCINFRKLCLANYKKLSRTAFF